MKSALYRFSLLAIIALLMGSSTTLCAQGRSIPKGSEAKSQEAKLSDLLDDLPEGQKYRYPLVNGLSLSVDLFDPVLYLTAFDHASFEVQATLDLHNRYFPMAVYGMGMCDELSNNGLEYSTGQKQECRFKSGLSPFGKVGMAYNFNYNDRRNDNIYMALVRYGIAYNKADITNLYYATANLGNFGPMDILDQRYVTHWLEVGGMIQVQIFDRFSLGWDLYLKLRLYQSGTDYGKPYFVPGYGTSSLPLGFSFRLSYKLF